MREYPSSPLPGALALVLRAGKVLLIQRAQEPDRGRWGLPGGLIEPGETAPEAAVRELAEETGTTAEPQGIIDVFDVIERDDFGRARFHYRLTAVACRWISGEPAAAADAADAGWFSPDELANLPTSRHLVRLVTAALPHPKDHR